MAERLQSQQLVVFSLGEEQYGLPIATVVEIIRYHSPRRIAANVETIRGVIALRGRIIPVFDLAAHLGSEGDDGADSKILIVEAHGSQIGLHVGDVDEVLAVSPACLEAAPVAEGAGITAIARVGDRLVMVLDLDQVLDGLALPAAA